MAYTQTMSHSFVGTPVTIRSRPTVCKPRGLSLRVAAKFAGNWLPGSKQPSYLEPLPAAYGFVSFHRTHHIVKCPRSSARIMAGPPVP